MLKNATANEPSIELLTLLKKLKQRQEFHIFSYEVKILDAHHLKTTGKRLKNCQSCIIEYAIELINKWLP